MLASSCSAEKQRSYGINEQEMGFLIHVELLSPQLHDVSGFFGGLEI